MATEPKFTPGPWSINGTWIMAGHLHVATIPRAHDGDWSPSNAHLIAAAPAMHEALVEARATIQQLVAARWSEAEGEPEDWTVEIDTALSLARGGGK